MFDFLPENIQISFGEQLINSVREGILVLDKDLNVKKSNTSYYDLFHADQRHTEGQHLFQLDNHRWDIPEVHTLMEDLLPVEKVVENYPINRSFDQLGHRVILLNARQCSESQLILLMFKDDTSHIELEENLRKRVEERTRQVRELAIERAKIEQAERDRIAEILHDELQQNLFAARMNLHLVLHQMDVEYPDQMLTEKCSGVLDLIDDTLTKTRLLSRDLLSLAIESESLLEMLDWLIQPIAEMHHLLVDVQAVEDFLIHNEETRMMLMRIIRELLFNTIKHADTNRATIELLTSPDNEMMIRMSDEGSGFDPDEVDKKEHTGLASAAKRMELIGGRLEVESAKGRGTQMTIILPMDDEISVK